MFGYSREEAIGASLDIIIPEKLRDRHWDGYRRVMATGETDYAGRMLAVPALRADGAAHLGRVHRHAAARPGRAASGASAPSCAMSPRAGSSSGRCSASCTTSSAASRSSRADRPAACGPSLGLAARLARAPGRHGWPVPEAAASDSKRCAGRRRRRATPGRAHRERDGAGGRGSCPRPATARATPERAHRPRKADGRRPVSRAASEAPSSPTRRPPTDGRSTRVWGDAIHEADLNLDGRSRLGPSVATAIARRRATHTQMPGCDSERTGLVASNHVVARGTYIVGPDSRPRCAPRRTATSRSPRPRVSDEPTQRRPRLASSIRASSGWIPRHVGAARALATRLQRRRPDDRSAVSPDSRSDRRTRRRGRADRCRRWSWSRKK